MEILRSVTELLYTHDCVTIPDFGGFILNKTSARIGMEGNMIFPPGRIITFNRNIRNNDGLLAGYIAGIENISFSDALNRIRETVRKWNIELESNNSFELSGIGKFSLSSEKNILFVPDKYANFSLEAFGLHPVSARPVEKMYLKERKESEYLHIPPEYFVQRHRKRNLILTGSAAVVLCTTTILFYLFNRSWISGQVLNLSSLEFFHTENTSYHAHNDFVLPAPVLSEDTMLNLLNRMVNNDTAVFSEKMPGTDELIQIKKSGRKKLFYVIGGCFKIYENSQKFIKKAKQKGYEPEIVDRTRGGLYRVCYKKSGSRKEALKALSKIKSSLNPDAWILAI